MELQQNDDNTEKPHIPEPSVAPTPSSNQSGGLGKNNKLIIGIVAGVAILLVVGAIVLMGGSDNKDQNKTSNGTSQGNKTDTHVSQEGGFSFTKPAGWVQGDTPNLGGDAVAVLYWPPGSTKEDFIAITVGMYPHSEGRSLNEFVEQGKAFLQNFPGFTVLETKEFKHNGNDAIYAEAKYSFEGKDIHQSLFAVKKGDKIYSITSTLPESEWAANQARIKTVSDSLKFE